LLDWLAIDFRKSGWDIKRLVKQIVMSATYRQSSAVSVSNNAIDPENIYLSRAPRLRLSAELVRDLVLSGSGLLVDEIGGPSVKPYQPRGIWEAATSGRGLSRYVQEHGSKLYRRGMYTFIKRTVPPPSLMVFDASNRDQCEVRRLQTSTPLQALVMMNDPLVLESARVLAERLMLDHHPVEATIGIAFRRIVCREPGVKEQTLLKNYFENERTRFSAQPSAAEKLIREGEFRHETIEDRASLAALEEVVLTLYNLEEAITKS
jgi:hypothetical protein